MAGAADDAPAAPTVDDLGRDLRVAEPSLDPIDLADVRARAEQALFGAAAPATLGRFTLLGPIASGGMGTVYSAYDPQLDRRVALKLLRPERRGDERERDRLLAEARALARVDHPNVVPVHDVVEVGDQIVVVMELVAGDTLAAWQATARSWSAVVDAYAQVARGLAAIHALGLVHRDVKPHNVVVGADGRVRVLDFGLAANAGADAPAPLAGTPGYLAPEMLASGAATAATDQFAFAVSLQRGLASAAFPDDRTAPRWLRAIVQRGLAEHPAARFPSMLALLAELTRPRGWRRWRWPAALLTAIAIVAVLIATRRTPPDPLAACDGGHAELAGIWDPPQQAAVQARLAGLPPPGPAIAARVQAGLDRYRGTWTSAHRAACLGRRQGLLTDALVERAAVCLRRRRDAFDAATRALASDAATVATALDVVAALPRADDCDDPDALLAEAALPPDHAGRTAVAALRADLTRAVTAERIGRSAEALAQARALVVRAEAVGHSPALAEVALALGRMHLQRGELSDALAPLRRAEELGFEAGLTALAIEAGARRIFVEARGGSDPDAVAIAGESLERVSRGLRDDRFARPLLLNNLGVVEMVRNRPQAARRWFTAGAELIAGTPEVDLDIELTALDHNLAMLTEDVATRERLAVSSWRRREAVLGPAHVFTIEAQVALGNYLGDPAQSLAEIEAACTAYAQFHPDLRWERFYCEARAGFLAFYLESPSTAGRHFVAAGDLVRDDPTAAMQRARVAGWAALANGAVDDARQAFDSALRAADPGDRWTVADVQLGAGLAAGRAGAIAAARAHLRATVSFYSVVARINADADYDQHLDLAQRELAALAR